MSIAVEKIPGGFSVDGLDLKNGKCGCTTVLPCCYSWSKVKRSGNAFTFIDLRGIESGKDFFACRVVHRYFNERIG